MLNKHLSASLWLILQLRQAYCGLLAASRYVLGITLVAMCRMITCGLRWLIAYFSGRTVVRNEHSYRFSWLSDKERTVSRWLNRPFPHKWENLQNLINSGWLVSLSVGVFEYLRSHALTMEVYGMGSVFKGFSHEYTSVHEHMSAFSTLQSEKAIEGKSKSERAKEIGQAISELRSKRLHLLSACLIVYNQKPTSAACAVYK